MTEDPPTITYTSIGSNETSRIYLTITILDDLEVKAADIERVCDLYISEKYIYITWVLVCSVLWK